MAIAGQYVVKQPQSRHQPLSQHTIGTGRQDNRPAGSRGTINYSINDNHYVAQPGLKQKLAALPNGRGWLVEFDRGGTFGTEAYTLAPGTYYFTATDRGWQLYGEHFEIVLDNSQSKQEFNFIFQGEDLTIPGGARTLVFDYPIVVPIGRGNDSEFVTKFTWLTAGTVQVGVNASDNMWDLFPTTDNRREASTKMKPLNPERQPNH